MEIKVIANLGNEKGIDLSNEFTRDELFIFELLLTRLKARSLIIYGDPQ